MTESEIQDESNRLHKETMSRGYVLRRQPHDDSDVLYNVYYEAVNDERRVYGEGASWEEAIIKAANKALKK
jgi:hypothetical protein